MNIYNFNSQFNINEIVIETFENKIFTEVMNIFYVLVNSVAAEFCCFNNWANWEENSLTCGQICKGRKRDICEGAHCIWNYCTYEYTECPWFELEKSSCNTITCRELIL